MSNQYVQNGQIYKRVSPDNSTCYVGSTTEGLSQRIARHRQEYNKHSDGRNATQGKHGLSTCLMHFERNIVKLNGLKIALVIASRNLKQESDITLNNTTV